MRTAFASCVLVAAISFCVAQNEPAEERPVVVANLRVNPYTGGQLGTIEDTDKFAFAFPADKPGHFTLRAARDMVWTVRVDAATGDTQKVHAFALADDRSVTRYAEDGTCQWSRSLPARFNSYRDPSLLRDDNALFVAHLDGVSAFELDSGEPRWNSKGESDRLCVFGDLLLAGECSNIRAGDKRQILARKTADGSEAWRVTVPRELEIARIETVGDHALAVSNEAAKGYWSWFIGGNGNVTLKLDEIVRHALPVGENWLIASSKRIAMLRHNGETVWEFANTEDDAFDLGECRLTIFDESLYVHSWTPIADRGVNVLRLDPGSGQLAWRQTCPPLNVGHSKYLHHVYIEFRGDDLVVISQGSYGWFVEVLAAKDGKRLHRHPE